MGLVELDSLRRRAIRQLGLKRITPDDCTFIVKAVDNLEAYIIKMPEKGAEDE